MGTIAFRSAKSVTGARCNDFGGGLLAEVDSVRLRIALRYAGQQLRQGGVKVSLLIRVERHENMITRRGILGSAAVRGEGQFVRGVAPLNGIHRLEHGEMKNR